jgi:uncharacterized protein HemY
MLAKWGPTKDPTQAHSIAWACALGPNSVADFKPVLRLAEMTVAQSPNDPNLLNALGAVLYRAGRSEEAIKRLQDSVANSRTKQGSAFDWLFLALAHAKLGHAEEANRCLAKASEFSKALRKPWSQQLEFDILHREAEAAVKRMRR